jgi:hypothetical protein
VPSDRSGGPVLLRLAWPPRAAKGNAGDSGRIVRLARQWLFLDGLPWGLSTKLQTGEEQGISSVASHSGDRSRGESQSGHTPSQMDFTTRGSLQLKSKQQSSVSSRRASSGSGRI